MIDAVSHITWILIESYNSTAVTSYHSKSNDPRQVSLTFYFMVYSILWCRFNCRSHSFLFIIPCPRSTFILQPLQRPLISLGRNAMTSSKTFKPSQKLLNFSKYLKTSLYWFTFCRCIGPALAPIIDYTILIGVLSFWFKFMKYFSSKSFGSLSFME